MTVAVRPFVETDRFSLSRAIDGVCAECRWMNTRRFEPTIAWLRAMEAPADPDYLLLVALDAAQVIGWCRLFPPELAAATEDAELGIGLLLPYREQGLGSALVHHATRWIRERSTSGITLTVHPGNAPALGLFRRFGFELTGEQVGYCLEMQWRPRQQGG